MSLYYECHITIEPVFDDRLKYFKQLCRDYHFRVADLLMQKRQLDLPTRSQYDTFCTGRHIDKQVLMDRMVELIQLLSEQGFDVWRYKIEDTLIDSKHTDSLKLLGEK